jgi:hypothetical protein
MVVSMDHVHVGVSEQITDFPTGSHATLQKGTVRPTAPFQCADNLTSAHVKQQYRGNIFGGIFERIRLPQ